MRTLAEGVVDGITALGGLAIAVEADVAVRAEVDAMVQTVREQLGSDGSWSPTRPGPQRQAWQEISDAE